MAETPPNGVAGAHDRHDPLLIAALVDEATDAADRAEAETLARSCPACATLAEDLRAIRLAVATGPTPPRPRDFRLTAADARRLRRRTGIRGLLGLGPRGAARAQPLGAGLAALGLAGLLLTTVPIGGGSSAAPAGEAAGAGAPQAEASPAAMGAAAPTGEAAPGGAATDRNHVVRRSPVADPDALQVSGASAGPDAGGGLTPLPAAPGEPARPPEAPLRAIVAIASVALVAAGSTLWLVARRLRGNGTHGEP